MKFLINRASDYFSRKKPIDSANTLRNFNEEPFKEGAFDIEINSLEELISLQEECEHALIINSICKYDDYFPEYRHSITIYDDYIE